MQRKPWARISAGALAGAAVLALGLGLASTPAAADDDGDWDCPRGGPHYGYRMHDDRGGYWHYHHGGRYGPRYYWRDDDRRRGRRMMDDDDDERGPYGMMRRGPRGRGMAMLDRDDDGVITAGEAAAEHEAMFEAMDDNGDSVLDKDEFMSMAPRGGGRGMHREDRFAELDADDDGNVSKGEYMAGAEKSFKAADADDDGRVTVWEYRAQPRPY
jgi:hypothetical protein